MCDKKEPQSRKNVESKSERPKGKCLLTINDGNCGKSFCQKGKKGKKKKEQKIDVSSDLGWTGNKLKAALLEYPLPSRTACCSSASLASEVTVPMKNRVWCTFSFFSSSVPYSPRFRKCRWNAKQPKSTDVCEQCTRNDGKAVTFGSQFFAALPVLSFDPSGQRTAEQSCGKVCLAGFEIELCQRREQECRRNRRIAFS